MTSMLPIFYLVLGGLTVAHVTWLVQRTQALPRVTLGRRGAARSRALASGLFRWIEPIVRWIAAVISRWPLLRVRTKATRELERSGSFLGLCADEFIALSAVSGAACAGLALLTIDRARALWLCGGLALGALLPWLVLRDRVRSRSRSITRRLPAALDLFALSLNAGLDFSASIDFVLSSFADPHEPLCEELHYVRQELAMGRPRRVALQALAERTDVPAVQELVRVVIQAERKGTPLATALEVQAEVARNRRAVLAEEAAARAAIMLLGPLMLILVGILLLLIGPLAIGRT